MAALGSGQEFGVHTGWFQCLSCYVQADSNIFHFQNCPHLFLFLSWSLYLIAYLFIWQATCHGVFFHLLVHSLSGYSVRLGHSEGRNQWLHADHGGILLARSLIGSRRAAAWIGTITGMWLTWDSFTHGESRCMIFDSRVVVEEGVGVNTCHAFFPVSTWTRDRLSWSIHGPSGRLGGDSGQLLHAACLYTRLVETSDCTVML